MEVTPPGFNGTIMSNARIISTVVLCFSAFGLIGGAAGATLGLLAPGYYRAVIRNGHEPGFDPLQVGIGLGSTQGMLVGIVFAVAILGLQTWSSVRQRGLDHATGIAPTVAYVKSWGRIAFWAVATTISLLLLLFVAVGMGMHFGEMQSRYALANHKLQKLNEILQTADLPDVHSESAHRRPEIFLVGTVANAQQRAELHAKLIRALGTDDADFMIAQVQIK